jgi:hypothetical protein
VFSSSSGYGRKELVVLKLSRAPIAPVGLVLLLVGTVIVRVVLLRRLPLPRMGVHDPHLVPTESEVHLREPETLLRHDADEALGASSNDAPAAENVTPVLSALPANRRHESLVEPAEAPGATSGTSAPPSLNGAAVAPAPPVMHRDQTTESPVAPPAGEPSRTGSDAAASLTPELSQPRPERRTDLALVRAWARENGYTVADRGRVAAVVLAAYDRAH